MGSNLTPTMKAALRFAADNDGKIKRYPGGFWGQNGMNTQQPWFGTTTIQALVSRGELHYSEWAGGEHRFPVEASIAEPQAVGRGRSQRPTSGTLTTRAS